MYMFNLTDKEIAISEAIMISELIKGHLSEYDTDKVSIFIKALSNYIEKTSIESPDALLQEIRKSMEENNYHRALQRMLIHMANMGTSEEALAVRMYTTGDIARFFGVSVATVNNWLNQGRFIGFEKAARYKQARIPENALYLFPTGDRMTIREVAETYKVEQSRLKRKAEMTPAEELAEMLSVVIHYEKKYGGEYKDTLALKGEGELTPEEERDAHEWAYLLRVIK
ncbi:helix-turn-helix domain-containing protein [Paenibacillus lentus]|uniref:helix-turn-helix domain-containing protein n=1 Tax=Paenibacillus lentus TaxID=1338368 RepID=UPI0036510108